MLFLSNSLKQWVFDIDLSHSVPYFEVYYLECAVMASFKKNLLALLCVIKAQKIDNEIITPYSSYLKEGWALL